MRRTDLKVCGRLSGGERFAELADLVRSAMAGLKRSE